MVWASVEGKSHCMIDLSSLLSPKSLAVIGASPDEGSLRGRIMRVLLCHDFKGKIYPVSRSNKEIMGKKAYASIRDIPGPVDLAVLIIPAEYVLNTLKECSDSNVKAALILSSGFAEDSTEEGDNLQKQLSDFAASTGMIISGPNSEGFANTAAKLCPTFSPTVDGDDIELTPIWNHKRRVAVIAQSGGMGFAFFDRARPKYLPFSHVITTGNEACLESLDILEYLINQDEADVFLMFMEDVKTPSKLIRVAEKALIAGKPIIVTKIGQSDAGTRAAASHTASLAGSYAAYRTIFERYGIIEGADIEEMVDIAAGFVYFGDRLPVGRRVGIFTASGGGGGWMADSCAANQLQVPILDPKARQKIDKYLPTYGTSQNPVDGTAGIVREVGYANISRMIASADNIDTVVTIASTRVPHKLAEEQKLLSELSKKTVKPIMLWSYTIPHSDSARILASSGLPLFSDIRNCTRTIAVMCDYRALRESYISQKNSLGAPTIFSSELLDTIESSPMTITEHRSMQILKLSGIESNQGILAQNIDEALEAAAQICEPVALKIQSPDLPHKSSVGGVILNVKGSKETCDAYTKIRSTIDQTHPNARIEGILVQAMSEPGLEMIVGITNKDGFGPIIMLGFGGITVEENRDVAFGIAPIDTEQCQSLIKSLRGSVLLNDVNYDLSSLKNFIVSLSNFAVSASDYIQEIDLNPILVHPPGQGVSVVDALMIRTDGALKTKA